MDEARITLVTSYVGDDPNKGHADGFTHDGFYACSGNHEEGKPCSGLELTLLHDVTSFTLTNNSRQLAWYSVTRISSGRPIYGSVTSGGQGEQKNIPYAGDGDLTIALSPSESAPPFATLTLTKKSPYPA